MARRPPGTILAYEAALDKTSCQRDLDDLLRWHRTGGQALLEAG